MACLKVEGPGQCPEALSSATAIAIKTHMFPSCCLVVADTNQAMP